MAAEGRPRYERHSSWLLINKAWIKLRETTGECHLLWKAQANTETMDPVGEMLWERRY